MKHGYYWVRWTKKAQHLEVAFLTKNSGWRRMGSEDHVGMGGRFAPFEVVALIDIPISELSGVEAEFGRSLDITDEDLLRYGLDGAAQA